MMDRMQLLPEFRSLLVEDRLSELGPGTPNVAAHPALEQLERVILPRAKNREFARACLAGMWLLHDFLDESHAISQDLHSAEGSYWHAIMHRREPDFWNSKYWFRRFTQHPIFADLRAQAAHETEQAGTPEGCAFLVRQKAWDPSAFVDLCEVAARTGEPIEPLCRRIQRCEWDLLFTYCHERAF